MGYQSSSHQILAPRLPGFIPQPHLCCVTLGKLLTLSVPHTPLGR